MPLKTQRDDQTAINLTPMIDIVFLLIIFFMVSSHFTHQSHTERDIAVRVPQVTESGALTAAPRNRVVDIYSDGSVALDSKVVSVAELESRLADVKRNYEQVGVIVRGDGDAPYKKVAKVIATCKKVKIRNLNIAVEERTASSSTAFPPVLETR